MEFEEIKSSMTESENKLWTAYTRENYSCLQTHNLEGCMFWTDKIDELFKRIELRLSEGTAK